jgi:2-hydroxy-3-keto-5-methylthiopentenyl-1-phosphate phosphatase
MMPAVLCDFDDTTAVENVAQLLLEHFCPKDMWQQLRSESQANVITFREYQEGTFSATSAGKEAMKALVKARATLRPHFKELWQYCRSRDIPMAIVTVGLDFYVDALLEREGLKELPRFAVKTSFTSDGIVYEYPHGWDGSGAASQQECSRWGNCKCSVLGKYRRMGHSIFYVGDGRSDFCAASIADRVFAREPLAQLCRDNGVAYTEFHDFGDVITELRGAHSLVDGGRP